MKRYRPLGRPPYIWHLQQFQAPIRAIMISSSPRLGRRQRVYKSLRESVNVYFDEALGIRRWLMTTFHPRTWTNAMRLIPPRDLCPSPLTT